MSGLLKGTITVFVCAISMVATVTIVNVIGGMPIPLLWIALGAALFGTAYGLQAGILGIYPLSEFKGWLELIVDTSWSLPNTLFGFIVGNIFYPFFADLSKSQSNSFLTKTKRSFGDFSKI